MYVINKKNEVGSTGVDIEGNIELKFDNQFTCKLSSSFKNNLGKKTIIYGEKGKLTIERYVDQCCGVWLFLLVWFRRRARVEEGSADREEIIVLCILPKPPAHCAPPNCN